MDIDREFDDKPLQDNAELAQGGAWSVSERPVSRPSRSRFLLRRGPRELTFSRRGRWSIKAIAATLFITVFWNGIVSTFLRELLREFDWFLFFFLIPFELFGAGLVIALFLSIAAPAVCYKLTVSPTELAVRHGIFGIGRTKRLWFNQLRRLVVTRKRGEDEEAQPLNIPAEGDFSLTFIADTNEELLTVNSLTQGEAQWMADMIMREFPHALARG